VAAIMTSRRADRFQAQISQPRLRVSRGTIS
jgi:hypothetical protein